MGAFDGWDYELALARLDFMDKRGYWDRYMKIINSGIGPRFSWLRDLDIHLQLMREDMESEMDEETRARFWYWRDQEEGQEDRRRCQAFMQGITYERLHPGEWRF